MSKVTIFSAPKPFSDPHINIIQCNAVRSWKFLGSDANIILIGDEPGIKETAEYLEVQHIPNVQVNNLGTPLVNSIFSLARQSSTDEFLLYINSDILLLPNTFEVILKIHQLKEEFLIVGRRWDLDVTAEITFDSDWSTNIREKVKTDGQLKTFAAMDFFIFPRHLYMNIPSFAIGRAGWDNWMVYHGMTQSWPVIDVTPSLTVVHQNHDYRHLPGGVAHYDLEESHQNITLGGGIKNMYDLLDVFLTFEGGRIISKKTSLNRFIRKLERIVYPDEQIGLRWSLTKLLQKTRKRINQSRLMAQYKKTSVE